MVKEPTRSHSPAATPPTLPATATIGAREGAHALPCMLRRSNNAPDRDAVEHTRRTSFARQCGTRQCERVLACYLTRVASKHARDDYRMHTHVRRDGVCGTDARRVRVRCAEVAGALQPHPFQRTHAPLIPYKGVGLLEGGHRFLKPLVLLVSAKHTSHPQATCHCLGYASHHASLGGSPLTLTYTHAIPACSARSELPHIANRDIQARRM